MTLLFLLLSSKSFANDARKVEAEFNKLHERFYEVQQRTIKEVKEKGFESFGNSSAERMRNLYNYYLKQLRGVLSPAARKKFAKTYGGGYRLFKPSAWGFRAAFEIFEIETKDRFFTNISEPYIRTCVNYGVALHEITHAIEFYYMSEKFGRNWSTTKNSKANARMWLRSEEVSHLFELSYLHHMTGEERSVVQKLLNAEEMIKPGEASNLKNKLRVSRALPNKERAIAAAENAGYDLPYLQHKCKVLLNRAIQQGRVK